MIAGVRSSFGLLLGNELRLYLRSGVISGTSVIFLVISQVLLHLTALGLALVPSSAMQSQSPGTPDVLHLMLAGGLLSMLMLMTSRSLAGAVQSLYTRGDLDLLLSSPVDRRAVIGIRMANIALTVTMEVALLVWPFANVFVLFGKVWWFKAYLIVPAMAMLATSIGLAVTLLCFRTLGPRRTRVVVQVLAVVMGVGMMLAFYLPGMFRPGHNPSPIVDSMNVLVQQGGVLRDLLLVPAHWVTQGYVPTLVFFVAAAALLVATIQLTGDRVVGALGRIAGGATRKPRAADAGSASTRFGGSFRTVIVMKELKLIARDPFLIAQILQQSLMVLPIGFVLWRSHMGGDLPLAWMSAIFLAAGLAGPLSWLTITAEDAPDLLAAAPVSRVALVRAKIEAALLPTLPICLCPLLLLGGPHSWYAVCICVSALGAALSNALLNMRNPVARRRDTFKMRNRGNGAHGLLELLVMAFWVLVCVGLIWVGGLLGWH